MGIIWDFFRAFGSNTDIETDQDFEQTLRDEGNNELLKLYQDKKSEKQDKSVVQRVKTPTVSQKERTEPTREDDEKELE